MSDTQLADWIAFSSIPVGKDRTPSAVYYSVRTLSQVRAVAKIVKSDGFDFACANPFEWTDQSPLMCNFNFIWYTKDGTLHTALITTSGKVKYHCTAKEQPSELDDVVAFDYKQQVWVSGVDAVRIRLEQILGELPMMKSAEYRKFIGVPDHEAQEAIERLQNELTMLHGYIKDKRAQLDQAIADCRCEHCSKTSKHE